jgi:SPP1 family predicted phage head-tail adaptor
MKLHAGGLRERIALESRITTRDAIGGERFSWQAEGTVWASVDAITGREAEAADQLNASTTLRVIIRPREIDQTWRIKWGTRTLSIEAVLPHINRDRLTLLCSDGINQADQ